MDPFVKKSMVGGLLLIAFSATVWTATNMTGRHFTFEEVFPVRLIWVALMIIGAGAFAAGLRNWRHQRTQRGE
jgi:frataxin-like iron-binding protein CyaY